MEARQQTPIDKNAVQRHLRQRPQAVVVPVHGGKRAPPVAERRGDLRRRSQAGLHERRAARPDRRGHRPGRRAPRVDLDAERRQVQARRVLVRVAPLGDGAARRAAHVDLVDVVPVVPEVGPDRHEVRLGRRRREGQREGVFTITADVSYGLPLDVRAVVAPHLDGHLDVSICGLLESI